MICSPYQKALWKVAETEPGNFVQQLSTVYYLLMNAASSTVSSETEQLYGHERALL